MSTSERIDTFGDERRTGLLDDGRTFAVLSAATFALKAIFVKLAYAAHPIDAVSLLALRMGIALPFFLWLARRERGARAARMTPRLWGGVLLVGFLGYYLSSLFDFIGLTYISTGLERLILFVYPTLVLLIGAVWLKQPMRAQAWGALAVCYLGLAAAVWHDLEQSGDARAVAIGGAWVFASSVTYALYYIGVGKLASAVGSTRLAAYCGATSCVMVLAHYAATGSPARLAELPASVWAYAAAMATISTVLPIVLLAAAIRRLGAGRAATFSTLGPVLTIAFAWVILGEPFTWQQVIGLALVVGGVSWLGRAR
ncbi:DMT family transporter [Sorangium sp. So ce1097]|uniref:DMT family transporter n=1 Tax=Sorangium sp. So ce1097 TaxID=3133330 RepID=UPI003F633DC9